MNRLRKYLQDRRSRYENSPRRRLTVCINAVLSLFLVTLAMIIAINPHNASAQIRAVAIIVAVCVIWLKYAYDKFTLRKPGAEVK